ncbi:MAG: DUF4860 domain-containing protein [Ruminococcaceae bacterium]|nr:DUF4860 domain-containing protein [Oscillospiraceae bacterium]
MKENTTKRSVSGLAALLLLGVFGASILLVLLTGANLYQMMIQRGRQTGDDRIRTQFIATSVRQAPVSGAITVESFGNGDALTIRQEIQGEVYLTRIYCYDGWLMQLFAEEDGIFDPQDGETIVPADQMTLSRENDLLRVEFLCGGQTSWVWLHLPVYEDEAV